MIKKIAVFSVFVSGLALAQKAYETAKVGDVQLVPAAALRPSDQSMENYDIVLSTSENIYTCRYVRHFLYRPNDIVVGSEVKFRVDGGHGYIERESGKEVKCSIIRVQKNN